MRKEYISPSYPLFLYHIILKIFEIIWDFFVDEKTLTIFKNTSYIAETFAKKAKTRENFFPQR